MNNFRNHQPNEDIYIPPLTYLQTAKEITQLFSHIQKHAILPDLLGGNFFWEEIFFGRKKREEKEDIFEKLPLNFEIFFWNKDKLIEEIYEENVSIV